VFRVLIDKYTKSQIEEETFEDDEDTEMSVQSISLTESKLITHKEASSALEIIWQWFL